jgi:hypothetical protein
MVQTLLSIAGALAMAGVGMLIFVFTGWNMGSQTRTVPRTRGERRALKRRGIALLAVAAVVALAATYLDGGSSSGLSNLAGPTSTPATPAAPSTPTAPAAPASTAPTSTSTPTRSQAPGPATTSPAGTGTPAPAPTGPDTPVPTAPGGGPTGRSTPRTATPTSAPRPSPAAVPPQQAGVQNAITSPRNGQQVSGSSTPASGSVRGDPASLFCIVQDESDNYFPYTARTTAGQWNATVGIGPPTITRSPTFTLLLATATPEAADEISRRQATDPQYKYTGIGNQLPSGIAVLAQVNVIRTA